MEMKVEKRGSVSVMTVSGRLDAVTSKAFEDKVLQMIDSGEKQLVLDCSNLDYISSAGLRALLTANRKLPAVNGKIVLASLKDSVKEIFDIAGFSPLFPMSGSTEEAVRQLSA